VLGFRYATPLPKEPSETPEVVSEESAEPELYGRETLARKPHRVVICEGEFDRLLLESRGFPAVTSTAGADPFLPEWAEFFDDIEDVFICFRRSSSSDAAAKKVQQLLPKARIAKLPARVGEGGSIYDYFLQLLRTNRDFEILLASGLGAIETSVQPPQVKPFRPANKAQERRAERIRARVRLHDVVYEFTNLQAGGGRLVGHCPFHNDSSRAFSVYPETDTYSCSVCGAQGDVVLFLMNKESMTFGQALEALERFEITHDLYGTS
jgi:DNA primase